jgi:hypothetical protein
MENSSTNGDKTKNKKKIELVFPESDIDIESRPVRRGSGGKLLQRFATSIDDITNWFNQYDIETIEVWISGGIETEGILKLAVSAKGEGGLKLTLKPKKAS